MPYIYLDKNNILTISKVIPELYDPLFFIMSVPMPLPPDIVKITAPLILGYLLQWSLFGVLSVQVYIYHLGFPNDPLQSKLLVYAVYVTEMVQTIIFARMAYIQFAAGYGNFDALDAIPVILVIGVPILSSIVAAVVQIFYAYGIKLLSESYLIPSVVVLLALLQLGGGIALGVLSEEAPFFSQLSNKKTDIAAIIWFGSSAVCDVLIAVYMTYALLSQKNSGLKKAQRLIHKLMRLIIETGMLIAALAIINLVLFLIPDKEAYLGATIGVLGKLYSNTMMVLLNSRMVYGVTNDTISIELPSEVTYRRSIFLSSQVGVSVQGTHESDSLEPPLEDSKMMEGRP